MTEYDAPKLLFQASMKFYDWYMGQLKPSPTLFLFKINERHLLYLLKGIFDAPASYFETIQHIGLMWVSEIYRTVLDRYADPAEQDRIYEKVKEIASDTFEIMPKIMTARNARDVQYFYGNPESETSYHEKIEQRKLATLIQDTLETYNKSHM